MEFLILFIIIIIAIAYGIYRLLKQQPEPEKFNEPYIKPVPFPSKRNTNVFSGKHTNNNQNSTNESSSIFQMPLIIDDTYIPLIPNSFESNHSTDHGSNGFGGGDFDGGGGSGSWDSSGDSSSSDSGSSD